MNTPNKLSILRMLMIPVVMFFYLENFFPYGKIVAAVVFVLAALTDMLDGYIARKYNLVTDLGKLLDTNADKILVLAGLLMIVCDGTVIAPWGVIIAVIILGRD
ncbi:MAG: CDP-alcohol phosphatidyltransferase family protein, partial [Clostridia bacterium]|nr:CDP-alcohol phosphatidyltransferase family protein [Clostridia bacterium]